MPVKGVLDAFEINTSILYGRLSHFFVLGAKNAPLGAKNAPVCVRIYESVYRSPYIGDELKESVYRGSSKRELEHHSNPYEGTRTL